MKKQTYKKLFTVATASAMAAGAVVAVAPAQADAAKSFSDVTVNNGHYENIMNLTDRKVITGYEDGTFRPGNSINRANAAKIIAGVLGLDTKNVTNPGFSDVSVNNANYGAIAALANAGIINGFEGKYNPAGTLTRGQMAKIIDNAFNLSGGDVNSLPFTDVQKSQYKVHIADLYENGVTTGVTATKFDEKSPVTRGQLASFVVRAEAKQGNDSEGGSEKPGTDTPGATTSTVEKAVTLLNVTNNLVTINGEQFEIAPAVADVFNTANAAALKDAETTLVVEYTVEPTASLANVAKKGKIVGVKSLKLVKSGTSFDAKGYTIPTLTVAADNVTVANTVSTTLDVAANNKVTLNGVTATTLTVGKGAKITLGAGFKFTTIKLASGDKIENVITNYAAVKDALKDTKIEQSSTGGGSGGSSNGNRTVTKADLDKALDKAKDLIKKDVAEADLTIGSVDFVGNDLSIKLADLKGDAYTVAEAREDLKELKTIITSSDIYKLADKVTFKSGNSYSKTQLTGLGELAASAIIATELLGEDASKALVDAAGDSTDLLGQVKPGTYPVTLTFITSDKGEQTVPYNVVIK